MKIRDPFTWRAWQDSNRDPDREYGRATLAFAERWADAMEAKIAEKKMIEAVANQCALDVAEDGMLGHQLGTAACVLAQVWEHGERLRKWFNREYGGGLGEEANKSGGIINPALIAGDGEKVDL